MGTYFLIEKNYEKAIPHFEDCLSSYPGIFSKSDAYAEKEVIGEKKNLKSYFKLEDGDNFIKKSKLKNDLAICYYSTRVKFYFKKAI